MSPRVKYQFYKHLSANIGIVSYMCDLYGVFCLGTRDFGVGIPVLAFSMAISIAANYVYWWMVEMLTEAKDQNDAEDSRRT